jgi:hypothetical protein
MLKLVKPVRILGFVSEIDYSAGLILIEGVDGNFYESEWVGRFLREPGAEVELVQFADGSVELAPGQCLDFNNNVI